MKKKGFLILLLMVWIAGGLLLGCRGEERPAPKPEDKKEEIPPALNAMVDGIHSIIENIEGIEDVLETKPEDIKPPQQQQQGGQQGGQQDQQKGQEQSPQRSTRGETQQQGGVRQISPQEQQEMKELEKQAEVLEKWKKAKDGLKSIHEAWNEYEPKAVKDGADSRKVEDLENSLNRLTSYVEAQDRNGVLHEANSLILALSGFLELYKGNPDGVLGKLEYAARQSYMDAKAGEWMQAAEKAKESSDQVGSLRQITDVEKKQESLVERLTLSLEDLEKAIAEENLPLLKIKRDIVIKNIETLKEEL